MQYFLIKFYKWNFLNLSIPFKKSYYQSSENSRDQCKLMVWIKNQGEIQTKKFKDVIIIWWEGCTCFKRLKVLILNYTISRKKNKRAKIKVFLLDSFQRKNFPGMLFDPTKKVRIWTGYFHKIFLQVIDNTTSRGKNCPFQLSGDFQNTLKSWSRDPAASLYQRRIS